ncbi:MAG: AAA family ATPase [Deltaproteobacteria bacterium]|nr:AAA family ATPase [Deltaproteobacteria bacterium]
MYTEHWGFKKFPFENVPDPSFFYRSKSHEEALTRLIYAAKMTKVYVQELSSDQFDIGLIINPKLRPVEFLQEVLYQFDIDDVPETKVQCLRKLNDKMMENMKENRETLLIVDEAQLLSESSFEEIRLLLNFQLNDRFLLTIVLIGQPELKDKIGRIEQLDQRIAIKYHLTPFNYDDTVRYIVFRQKIAGRGKNVFSREAIERIYKTTQGVPRRINNLCDLSLLIGFSKNGKMIDSKIIEDIMKDGAIF